MDEAAYRAARGAAVPLACVFEKALAAGCATCATSVRRALAEREAIGCTSPTARTNCTTLAALLQERATFALKLPPGQALPHAATLRLACGGLAGVRACVDPGETDVHRLVVAAQQRFGSLVALPWQAVVASIVAWQARRPSGGRPLDRR
jgi:hypothetical protein